jgi:hypothetical protein
MMRLLRRRRRQANARWRLGKAEVDQLCNGIASPGDIDPEPAEKCDDQRALNKGDRGERR